MHGGDTGERPGDDDGEQAEAAEPAPAVGVLGGEHGGGYLVGFRHFVDDLPGGAAVVAQLAEPACLLAQRPAQAVDGAGELVDAVAEAGDFCTQFVVRRRPLAVAADGRSSLFFARPYAALEASSRPVRFYIHRHKVFPFWAIVGVSMETMPGGNPMADLYETCEYCGTDAALAYSSDGNVLLCDSCRPGYDAEHVPNPIEQREPFRIGGAVYGRSR